jgi:uncharacterized protein (TIGR02646 family)
MIFVRKNQTSETAFVKAVDRTKEYSKLSSAQQRAIVEILYSDQGHICAICEQKRDKVGGTIEHFLPKSIFGDLQLEYSNLYMSCSGCEKYKGNHLVPAFMFDPRFDPCRLANFYDQRDGLKPRFDIIDGMCYTKVPTAIPELKKEASLHLGSHVLQSTLNLLNQNSETLLKRRASSWKVLMYLYHRKDKLPDSALILEWKRIQAVANNPTSSLPEFVSLRLFLLREALKKRPGITPEMLQ